MACYIVHLQLNNETVSSCCPDHYKLAFKRPRQHLQARWERGDGRGLMPGHRFVAYHGHVVYGRLDLRSFLCFILFIKSLKTGFEFTHTTKGAKQICAGRMPTRESPQPWDSEMQGHA